MAGIDRVAAVAQNAYHRVGDGGVVAAADGALVTNDRRRALIANQGRVVDVGPERGHVTKLRNSPQT
jgi:hypothetical protein